MKCQDAVICVVLMLICGATCGTIFVQCRLLPLKPEMRIVVPVEAEVTAAPKREAVKTKPGIAYVNGQRIW